MLAPRYHELHVLRASPPSVRPRPALPNEEPRLVRLGEDYEEEARRR
jgi:hypothetical protein